MSELAVVVLQWFDSLLLRLEQLEPYSTFLLLLAALAVTGILIRNVIRILRGRRVQDAAWPELLISGGQTQPLEDGVSLLTLSVSNLNPYPVQLLELAVSTGADSQDVQGMEVAGINELLGPNRQLVLDVQLTGLDSRNGLIDLYFYTTIGTSRHYRLQAKLQWQPWSDAHKVVLLEQWIGTAQELASQQIERQRRQLWQKNRRRAKRFVSPLAPAGLLPLSSAARSGSQPEGYPEINDFPADF